MAVLAFDNAASLIMKRPEITLLACLLLPPLCVGCAASRGKGSAPLAAKAAETAKAAPADAVVAEHADQNRGRSLRRLFAVKQSDTPREVDEYPLTTLLTKWRSRRSAGDDPSTSEPSQATEPGHAEAIEQVADAEPTPRREALREMASTGCAQCYPEVQDALVSALDDRNEWVRFEAVAALKESACEHCPACKNGPMLSPQVAEKLTQLANGTDKNGNFTETSARVRGLALCALAEVTLGKGNVASTVSPAAKPTESKTPESVAQRAAEGPSSRRQGEGEPSSAAVDTAAPPDAEKPDPEAKRDPQVVLTALETPLRPAKESPPAAGGQAESAEEPSATRVRLLRAAPQLRGDALSDQARASIEPAGLLVVARIGDQVIHEPDVDAFMAQVGAPPRGTLQAGDDRERFQQFLAQLIDHRLWLHEARRQFSTDELARLSQATQNSDARFQPLGEEANLVATWKQRYLESQISDAEVRAHYEQHLDEFQSAEAIRWERITARRDRFANTLDAWKQMLELRDQLIHAAPGAPVPANLEPLEYQACDWTTRRQAPSMSIAQVLWNLPQDQWCELIEDVEGFHLLRMRARRPERHLSYEQAAPEIRAAFIAQRREALEAEHLAALREATPIWTIHQDQPDPGASAAR